MHRFQESGGGTQTVLAANKGSHEAGVPENEFVRLLRAARIEALPRPYAFATIASDQSTTEVKDVVKSALALVRDGGEWSALIPCDQTVSEPMGIFSVYFLEDIRNAEFTSWLATELREVLGIGAVIICGYSTRVGGTFDYWGVPWRLLEVALVHLESLRLDGDGPSS